MAIKFYDCSRLDMLLLNYPLLAILSTCIIAQKKKNYVCAIKVMAASYYLPHKDCTRHITYVISQ